jgi:hypothetical protein
MKKLLKKMPVIDIHGKDAPLLKTYATLMNYSKNALVRNLKNQLA